MTEDAEPLRLELVELETRLAGLQSDQKTEKRAQSSVQVDLEKIEDRLLRDAQPGMFGSETTPPAMSSDERTRFETEGCILRRRKMEIQGSIRTRRKEMTMLTESIHGLKRRLRAAAAGQPVMFSRGSTGATPTEMEGRT